MPELPEVEVTCQGLLPHVIGCSVLQVYRSEYRLRDPLQPETLKKLLQGAQITALERRAKYLLFRFADETVLVIHLGMTGKLGIFHPSLPRAKHDHFALQLSDTVELRFNDARRFGTLLIWPPEQSEVEEKRFFGRTGPEPLGTRFTGAYLNKAAKNKRTPIKTFLMDSKIVVGIGNIYANEILFACGVHPSQPVNTVALDTWKKIVIASRKILRMAIAAGGTTISDFLNAGGQPGYFQVQLKVYGKNGKQCEVCTATIEKKVMAGRASFFCPRCQQEKKRC